MGAGGRKRQLHGSCEVHGVYTALPGRCTTRGEELGGGSMVCWVEEASAFLLRTEIDAVSMSGTCANEAHWVGPRVLREMPVGRHPLG